MLFVKCCQLILHYMYFTSEIPWRYCTSKINPSNFPKVLAIILLPVILIMKGGKMYVVLIQYS